MKDIRKALSLFLALVMALSLSISAMAADYPAEKKSLDEIAGDLTGKTVILHTNDVHGAIGGYAYIAALRAELEGRGSEVILADAGDFSQGDPNVSVSKGATAVELMNAAGYDVATLGNHEFDYGYDQITGNLKAAEFKVINANILKDGEAAFDPTYVHTTKSGVKIGFFGLDTPEAQTKTNPALIQGMTVLSNSNGKTDLYDCAKQQVADLKSAGVDLIIGLWHLGVDDESKTDGHRSVDVLDKLEGVDLVIDGHSHTVMTAGENGEIIQSTGTKFANIGAVIIDDASKKIEARCLIPVLDADNNPVLGLDGDETVGTAAAKIAADINAKYGAVFAKSEVELNGEQEPGNRTQETNNGDLITDAMRWSVLKEKGSLTVDADHVVAITNGGGIRAAIKAGDVTMKDVNTVLPFGNTVTVVYVTGAELLEALEASTFCTPTKVGAYPQTAGIKFTLDTTKEYDANAETYPGSTYYGPKSIQRVSIESVNGKAFDKAATYAVVTNNFCAAGGDTYYAFASASAQFDTGIPLDEAVMDYITTELKGVITAEKYGQARGDQTIKLPLPTSFTVILTNQKLTVNGEAKETEIYNIDGSNFFKLRDMAALLSGTDSQFSVDFDSASNTVVVKTGEAYASVGGELATGTDKSDSAVASAQSVEIDGAKVELTAFNIGGNNFFKLRDLGTALGFGVDYDEATATMLVTSK